MVYDPARGAIAFCTAFAENQTVWEQRYRRWITAMTQSRVAWSQLVIVDDGSPVLPDWSDVPVVCEGEPLVQNPIAIRHFTEHLGRHSIRDYPGWYRSFSFMGRYAQLAGFRKAIHIESDAFLISAAMQDAFNDVREGWSSVWIEHYQMPESAIQVVAGQNIKDLAAWCSVPYSERKDKDVENILPFTHIMKQFKGGRYGEFQDFVPRDADWTVQVFPPAWNDPDYFWWTQPDMRP